MRRAYMLRGALAMTLAAILVNCSGGGDSPTGVKSGESISGNYVLQSIGGNNLPAAIMQDATGKLEIISGHINFNADKSWTASMTYRVTATGMPVQTSEVPANGTYRINGSAVIVRDESDGSEVTGTLSGSTLSTVFDFGGGLTFAAVFKK